MQAYSKAWSRCTHIHSGSRRRGTVIPFTGICMLMILGFAALTIDSGRLYVAKGELQNTADAAALAAAVAMISEEHQKGNSTEVQDKGYAIASSISKRHKCHGKALGLQKSEVKYGRIETPDDLKEPLNTATTEYNAVYVKAERTTASN